MGIDLSVPSLREMRERRSEKWALYEPDVLSLTIAEMDFPIAPPIREALVATIDRSDLGYGVPTTLALSDALAGFAQRRLHWNLDPEQVTVTPDVMLGVIELCRVIATPGEAVAFATPAYPPFFRELSTSGLRIVELRLAPDGSVDLDSLDDALKEGIRAVVLANPHNPTGRVLPRGELEAIAERCAAADTWVLADEIHAALTLPGAVHCPWLEVSDAARRYGICLTSASKAFNLAALKTAFIVTAGKEAQKLVGRIGPQHEHASLLGEIAAEIAFREADPWLDAVIEQLVGNRKQLGDELAQFLPSIRWKAPQASYLAWLDYTELELGEDPAATFLEQGRVAVGRGLDYGSPGAGHVRLNFATSPEHLTEALRRMKTSFAH